MSTQQRHKLGFIGAGNMAEAIARAAIDHDIIQPQDMVVSDPSADRRNLFAAMDVAVTDSNSQVIESAQQIMLAVKPQVVATLGDDLARIDVANQIVISIMAGVTCAKLVAMIAPQQAVRIVRVMPNTPLLVGEGTSGIALGQGAQSGDDELAMEIFGAAGLAVRVEESQLDAITAVSGSGPAYLFYLAEAMEQAAEELGLGEDKAMLVRRTLFGASKLLLDSEESAGSLRRKVTSPGGTTEAAIKHIDGNATTQVIVNAIKAAAERSRELGA